MSSNSLVNDIIMPPVGVVLGGVDFSALVIKLKDATVDAAGKPVAEVDIRWGSFINIVIAFIVIAFVVYMISKAFIKEEVAAALEDLPGVQGSQRGRRDPLPGLHQRDLSRALSLPRHGGPAAGPNKRADQSAIETTPRPTIAQDERGRGPVGERSGDQGRGQAGRADDRRQDAEHPPAERRPGWSRGVPSGPRPSHGVGGAGDEGDRMINGIAGTPAAVSRASASATRARTAVSPPKTSRPASAARRWSARRTGAGR